MNPETQPIVFHDWSPHSDCCTECGIPRAGSRPECVPTTAEPGEDVE